MRRAAPLLVAVAAVAAVVVPYLALGGASFEPAPVADPCLKREWRDPGDLEAVLEQIVLSALDGAACELGVTRARSSCSHCGTRTRSKPSPRSTASPETDAEQLVEDGLERAIGDAEDAGALPGFAASLFRRAAEQPAAVAPAGSGRAVRRAALSLGRNDPREPVANRRGHRFRVRSQAVVAGHLDHCSVGHRRWYAEPVPRALDDERRHGHRVELGQPALDGRRAARRYEREGEAEHGDRAGRSRSAARDASAQRATADDESKTAELLGAETIDDGRPGCVEMVCGRRARAVPRRGRAARRERR